MSSGDHETLEHPQMRYLPFPLRSDCEGERWIRHFQGLPGGGFQLPGVQQHDVAGSVLRRPHVRFLVKATPHGSRTAKARHVRRIFCIFLALWSRTTNQRTNLVNGKCS
jgi:hypothetical protein